MGDGYAQKVVLEKQFSWGGGLKAFLGEKSLGNYIFWGVTALLTILLIKESFSPSWMVHWSHPKWGTVNVAPVTGIGIGLLAGFMGGAVGAFISLFSIPLYTIWLGLPVKVALGTNSMASAIIGLFAAWVHLQKKTPNMKVAIPMMVAGLLGAAVGAYISLGIPSKTLQLYFSVLVFLAAGSMIYRTLFPAKDEGAAWIKTEKKGFWIAEGAWLGQSYRTDIVTPGIGNFFIAIISGIVGVGGGFLFTPMLHTAFGLPLVVAVGTGNFVKVANIGSQFIVRGVAETVIYPLAIFAMAGGYCGARLGRRLSLAVNPKYLRIFFGIALIIIGLQYVGIKLTSFSLIP
jgi:uncharacterized membrane protein YfcA